MSQKEYSTKKSGYKQLTPNQRAQIEVLSKEKYTQTAIAKLIKVSQSTVSRELSRNSVQQMDSDLRMRKRYYADAAQRQMLSRRQGSGNPPKYLRYPEVIAQIEADILEKRWSPDASIGRMERESGKRCPITTRTFYHYVERGVVKVKPIDLHQKVRRKPKAKPVERKHREIGRSIEMRPSEVANRETFGHWEIDGVVGKSTDQAELMTLVERKTRKGIVIRLKSRTQDGVAQALRGLMREYKELFPKVFKSITSDNGGEFLNWRRMERGGYRRGRKQTQIYYAHPYRASERGGNENYNGILRRVLPKGLSIDMTKAERIDYAMKWTNGLPRRILRYQTADEAFAQEIARLKAPT